MSQIVYGDLDVKRTINADRRVNAGLSKETIIAARPVTIHDFSWLQIINASTQDVVLPDATTLANGWSVVVMADAASGASVNAKSYHITVPVLVKNILIGRAYRFTLIDNGTSAGVWHVDFLEESDLIAVERYVSNFNATTDWGTAALGYYSITIAESVHGRGASPMINTNKGPAPFIGVMPDQISIAANGDTTVRVCETPDLRFAGQLIFV